MTPDEIKSAITGWANQGTGLQLVEDRSEPGADFVLGLRSASHGSAGTVPVEVRLDQGADRVTVSSTATSSAGSDEVRTLLESRPASVSADTSSGGTVITSHVYTDGLSKHALVRAVAEVAKTRALVDGLAGRRQPTAAARTPTRTRASLPTGGDLGQGFPTAPTPEETKPAEPSWSAQPRAVSAHPELQPGARADGDARRLSAAHRPAGPAGAPGAVGVRADPHRARPGDAGVGRTRPQRRGGGDARRRPADPDHRGARRLGARALLQRLDGLGRRPHHRRGPLARPSPGSAAMELREALYEAGDDGVATITLNRPEQRNPLGPQMVADLTAALRQARDDDAVRAVVLTGAGDKAFCAGADLSSWAADAGEVERHLARGAFVELFLTCERLGKPLVGCINGHALAGGFGLALCCDLLVSADTATFGTPEIKVGVWPMMIMSIVTRNLGRKRALELFMTGARIDAATALQWGFVNRVVPAAEVREEAHALGRGDRRLEPAGHAPRSRRLLRDRFPRLRERAALPAGAAHRGVDDRGLPRGRHRLPGEARAELPRALMSGEPTLDDLAATSRSVASAPGAWAATTPSPSSTAATS